MSTSTSAIKKPKPEQSPTKEVPKKNAEGDEEEEGPQELESDPEQYLDEDESLDLNLDKGSSKIWLVRLPRYLAEKWKNVDDLDGKDLGKVRIKQDKGNLKVKLVLNETPENQEIPHEYDISLLNTAVQNEYIFNEKNLNKFKTELTEIADMPEQPQLKSLNKKQQPQRFRIQKEMKDGKTIKRYIPYVKTIPKKTALIGTVVHDCQIIPSKNDSKYTQILAKRTQMQPAKVRPKVTLLEEIPGIIQSNAGPSIKGNNASVFLKQNRTGNKGDGRAIRMPKKDLLDLLFRLFDEYEYWSMKGLKERTRQPESYLKESLDSIANLIKKGPYTSKYNLKPEYKRLRDAERAERLGIDLNDKEEEEDNEDDDIEMEDIA